MTYTERNKLCVNGYSSPGSSCEWRATDQQSSDKWRENVLEALLVENNSWSQEIGEREHAERKEKKERIESQKPREENKIPKKKLFLFVFYFGIAHPSLLPTSVL